MKYPGMNQPAHTIWVLLGLKAFVAAVIGGIGNLYGLRLLCRPEATLLTLA